MVVAGNIENSLEEERLLPESKKAGESEIEKALADTSVRFKVSKIRFLIAKD